MRPGVAVRHVALLLALALPLATAGGREPRVVDWGDAAAHAGEFVAVEGEVAAVHEEGGSWVLAFAPEDPRAFRAVLVPTLLGRTPTDPARQYGGRRVRVEGRIHVFAGRPEMVLTSPADVVLVEETPPAGGAEPPAADPGPATPPAPPPSAVSPAPAAMPPPTLATATPCAAARAGWREAAAAATSHADALARCVAAEDYRCRSRSVLLARALATLDAAEGRVETDCR